MAEPFLGEIIMFGGSFAPRGWALCNGQLLAISSNEALFSILGTAYGGDGRSDFGLPEMRGRFPLHPGTGPGLPNYNLGQRGGNFEITPPVGAHVHTYTPPAFQGLGDEDSPTGHYHSSTVGTDFTATTNTNMGPGTTASAGSNTSISIQNPFQAVNFIIALVGTFPARN